MLKLEEIYNKGLENVISTMHLTDVDIKTNDCGEVYMIKLEYKPDYSLKTVSNINNGGALI